jgi:hypothetical protein
MSINYEFVKFFSTASSEHIHNTPFSWSLNNGPNKLVFDYPRLERLAGESALAYWARSKVTKKIKFCEYGP